MLKSETIKELKQTNVSQNSEKTMERLKSIWRPLTTSQRDEILTLSGLQKSSIERAYKTGNVSAKIISAVSQVVEVDPLYLSGVSDAQRPYDDDLMVDFLINLGYDIGKQDIIKKRKPRKDATPAAASSPLNSPASDTPPNENTSAAKYVEENDSSPSSVKAFDGLTDFSSISQSLSALLDGGAKDKLDTLSEDDIILMIKSLSVQANINLDKKNKLELIKCLLLI